ncbi:hypothetical protein [Hydrogenophaga luteola]|uniref:DUF481 domain-containing protein n=1 Tax=Hydrogenophaga luteola TaxID=1591122 RepID=A0ABV7WAA1_9BURK
MKYIKPEAATSALVALVVSVVATAAHAQSQWTPSLKAADSPAAKPWEDGATLAVSSVDGQTVAVADAVFKLERVTDTMSANGFVRQTWGPGLYLSRNSDPAKRTNDRGVKFSYGGLWVDNGPASGARTSWGWAVDLKAGKKLSSETVAGQKVWFDRDSTRLTGGGQFVYAPSLGRLDPNNLNRLNHFYTASTRLYVDRASGGSAVSGRVSGVEVGLRADVAPFGLEPLALLGSNLAVVPTAGVWAQYQNDLSASGGRAKDERQLFGVKLGFSFSRPDSEGVVPGISLERTVGSDLLTGRSPSGVTKLVLSLKY